MFPITKHTLVSSSSNASCLNHDLELVVGEAAIWSQPPGAENRQPGLLSGQAALPGHTTKQDRVFVISISLKLCTTTRYRVPS